MTSDQLATKIKTQYPQYNSVDNTTLVSAITKKYPQYENYSQMDQNGQTPNPAAGQLFDWIFNKIPQNAAGNQPGQNPNPINLGSILDSLTASAQSFGQAASGAISSNLPDVKKTQQNTQTSANELADMNSKLMALSKQKKAAGQDTSAIDSVIADNEKTMSSGNIGMNANSAAGAHMTPGQVVGSAAEMALDILSSGELQDAAKGADSFKLIDNATKTRLSAMGVTDSATATSLISKLKVIGKFALQSGSIGYGFDVSKNLQNGATGASVATPGWGTLVGTLLPVALGTYAGARELMSPGKTLDQILATSPEDVQAGKLSAADTKTWFDNQSSKTDQSFNARKQALNDKFDQANQARKTDLATSVSDSKAEQAELQKQMEGTAIQETKTTRPKILATFAKASKIFADLAEEAVDNSGLSRESDIGAENIKAAFSNEFSEDPEIGTAQMKRIGLSSGEDPMAAILGNQSGGSGEVQEMSPTNKLLRQLMGEGDNKESMTVGEVQQKIKDLRQTMSSGGRTGARTFSAAELTTSRTIAALSDALDKAGVDMSEANNFWKEWKPVQQEAMRTFDPFGAKGSSGLKSGASALMEKAGGNQFTNDFFSKLEGYMGSPIGDDTKAAFDKMSVADQQAVANSKDLQSQISKAKQELDAANAQIDAEEKAAGSAADKNKYEALRKVKSRTIRNRVILGVAALTGISEIPQVKNFVSSLIAAL